MRGLSKSEWTLFIALMVFSFIPTFGGLFRLVELGGGPVIAPVNPRALAGPLPIVLHILGSVLFGVIGPLQFLPSLRRRRPLLHRYLGCVFVLAGSVVAVTGLWMTLAYDFPADLQGPLLLLTRLVVSAMMLGALVWAAMAISLGDIPAHSAAMMRAYAIGLGASTQTFLGLFWTVMLGAEPLGLERDIMMTAGWVINLAAAETLIAMRHKSPSGWTKAPRSRRHGYES